MIWEIAKRFRFSTEGNAGCQCRSYHAVLASFMGYAKASPARDLTRQQSLQIPAGAGWNDYGAVFALPIEIN